MSRCTWTRRLALWAAVAGLLLKSAVPLLAAGAATSRQLSVASICSVYGVALPGASAGEGVHDGASGPGGHAPDDSVAHRDDHCALNAFAMLAPPSAPALLTAAIAPAASFAWVAAERPASRDANARWIARRKHGPPLLA